MSRPPEPFGDVSFRVRTCDGRFIAAYEALQSLTAISWGFFITGEMGHSRSLVGAWPVHLRADGFAEMGHSRSLVGAWPVHLRADGFAVAMDAPSGPLERKRLIPFGKLKYLR